MTLDFIPHDDDYDEDEEDYDDDEELFGDAGLLEEDLGLCPHGVADDGECGDCDGGPYGWDD